MSDNKELLTIAVIAAALMMVLGTSIPSSVLASTSIEAAEPSDDSGNDDSNNSGDSSGNSDESTDGNSDNNSSNDSGDSGSKDDSKNDENSDDGSSDSDSSDSNNGGVPEEYLGEYSTCVSDLSSDDSILTQDDVVDCYGQVFGPNPSHELGPLMQSAPTSPATNMPGFENMPSALQQPADEQQQMQPFGQTQPQDGQQLPIQQQPQTGVGGQQQMSPTELPIDAGILDVETIKEIVKNRLAQ